MPPAPHFYANKRVAIVGASRGLGLEFVAQLLARGNAVHATARAPAASKALAALAAKAGPALHVAALDVACPASIDAWAAGLSGDTARGGPFDLLINNAGVAEWSSLGSVTQESMLRLFSVNAVGPLLVTQAAAGKGLLRKGSVVANITSKMGSMADNGSGGTYAYRASKAALNAVTVSLARDLSASGVVATLLHPGWVRTDMTSNNGLIDVQQVGRPWRWRGGASALAARALPTLLLPSSPCPACWTSWKRAPRAPWTWRGGGTITRPRRSRGDGREDDDTARAVLLSSPTLLPPPPLPSSCLLRHQLGPQRQLVPYPPPASSATSSGRSASSSRSQGVKASGVAASSALSAARSAHRVAATSLPSASTPPSHPLNQNVLTTSRSHTTPWRSSARRGAPSGGPSTAAETHTPSSSLSPRTAASATASPDATCSAAAMSQRPGATSLVAARRCSRWRPAASVTKT